MLTRVALLAGIALAASQEPGEPPIEPLLEAAGRQRVRTLTTEIARLGDVELIDRMRAVLVGLGDEGKNLERLSRDWERTALSAKPGRSARAAVASKLRRELTPLVEQLAREDEPKKSELARWILALDSGEPSANAILGRERDADGAWLTRDQRIWKNGAQHVEGLARAADELLVEVEHGASSNPALRKLCGGGNVARARGIELHSRLPPEKLERILRQGLRAAALSRGLLSGQVDLPKPKARAFVLLDTEEHTRPALDEARAAGLPEAEYARVVELDMRSFNDVRGWRTSRWRSEAEFEALILWELLEDWLGPNPQPCLRVGHLNWVCLSYLGTSLPMIAWSETVEQEGAPPGQRSSAQRELEAQRQTLWRCARQSLWGTRAWMIAQARDGRDPAWVRSMLDQDGKIRDENLLKTTLVCELLQEEQRLWDVLKATRGKSPPVAAFEHALGEPLPDFEARWRLWLDPPREVGVLQRLEDAPASADAEGPFAAAHLALNQARADALAGQRPEIQIVALDPELCRAAESHARYLTLNPAQKEGWPAAHEEYAGAPGFTPAGALAGARSVIALTGDPLAAVHDWLGTFYHRLPLLNPGLFGAGFGRSDEVIVLDVGSLVVAPWKDHVVLWPLPDAIDVPRAFRPELPNPVPGEDMSRFGYPVTVQLFFQAPKRETSLTLELRQGDEPVDCHLVTPHAPLQLELVPENAWCLIPKAPLAKKTLYTASAAWLGEVRTWSFTTTGD